MRSRPVLRQFAPWVCKSRVLHLKTWTVLLKEGLVASHRGVCFRRRWTKADSSDFLSLLTKNSAVCNWVALTFFAKLDICLGSVAKC